jgi:hypothetical protein
METLLRQKVCKSKHNFLITKQLEEKKDERKKRKGCFFQKRKAWDLLGYAIPALRSTSCHFNQG